MNDYSKMGRQQLIDRLKEHDIQIADLQTQLTGLHIPGWWCVCSTFNGEVKESRPNCRVCDAPKRIPNLPTIKTHPSG